MATAPNFPRVVIDHGRYWRGKIQIWSTTYFLGGGDWASGEAASCCSALTAMENALLFEAPAHGGYFTEARAYGPKTGAPEYIDSIADPADPTTWGDYNSSIWEGVTGAMYNPVAEAAMYVETPLAGLNSRGKPVKSVKYLHSVPVLGGSAVGDDAIPGSVIVAAQAQLAILNTGVGPNNRRMITNGGRYPSAAPTLAVQIGNHQMPQGRRKKKVSSSNLPGILTDLGKIKSALSDIPDL